MSGRRFARRGSPAPSLAALLTAGLTAGLVVLTAAACTGSSASTSPDDGMSGMPGMSGMAGMGTGDTGDMPGMGDVTSAPTTAALAAAAPAGTGLLSSLHGYTLVPSAQTITGGASSAYTFHVTGPDGKTLTRYQPYESAFVICYVIRSDLTEYHYLEPAMREDGTWSVALPALPAGSYRAFATFAAPDSSQGTPLVYQLSAPFTVAGRAAAASAAPAPVSSATTSDGYTISLSGDPKAKVSGPLKMVVVKGGKPVESFQRFLDAYVHLTAFHAGDLAFAQILSLGGVQAKTGAMTAEASFPESGTWQVFAQFDVDGSVHTAVLTLDVP
jgi:hypothetical protein